MKNMINNKRIMITGTKGFVGARAKEHFSEAISVPSVLVRNAGNELVEYVKKYSPDIILNCAAISDIGVCEKNSDASYEANVKLPVMLAKASKEVGCRFISFSSDQVYTGFVDDGPYSDEIELPEPKNIYARHKLEADKRVLDINSDSVMLRATWMYDMPMYNHQNRGNFLVNTLNSVIHGEKIRYSLKEYRGITYVRQVVELLDEVFSLPGGVYNYGSENSLNMYDTAKTLLKILGFDDKMLLKDTETKRRNLWLNCEKLRKHGILFDTTAQGFLRCASDYGIAKQMGVLR